MPIRRACRMLPESAGSTVLRAMCVLAVLVVLSGCVVSKVRARNDNDYVAGQRSDVLGNGRLSNASREALGVAALAESGCSRLPGGCMEPLLAASGLDEERRQSALAELWLQRALALAPKNSMSESDEAIDAYLHVARHAYAYLFFTERAPADRAFEARQSQVRDYYNYAVQRTATGLFERFRQTLRAGADAPLRIGSWTVSPDMSGLRTSEAQAVPTEIVPAASLRFAGLRSVYLRDGLGADVVAVMDRATLEQPAADAEDATAPYPPSVTNEPVFSEMPSPATTALLRFDGDSLQDVLATDRAVLAGYDPYRQSSVQIQGRQVPLSANFTAGYGLWLARADFARQSLRSLVGRARGIVHPHIYLMQPYDPDRRIVLMLHGLASSPEAWVNVANEVLGDQTLREHYQVWQVYYPTNVPVLLNHRAIRDAVAKTLRHFDPCGDAVASHDMVLVGHSMGGVIARLMISSSGGRLWDALMDETPPARRAELEHNRAMLDSYLRFEPMAPVGRAIFIAAPHQGTPKAGSGIARMLSKLVRLPPALMSRFSEVLSALGKPLPNSIDNLQDTDPFVRAAAGLPVSPRVPYHSIIAERDHRGPLAESDDGLVPYRSAHLSGAASEKIVASGHSVQETAQAILELRRILHEDLAAQRR